MPSITNVGGSLTTALALSLLAWGVRTFRATALSGPVKTQWNKRRVPPRAPPAISAAGLKMMVRTNAVAHLVVDVRDEKSALRAPLPKSLESAVNIPELELQKALMPSGVWPARFSTPPPRMDTMLVFVAGSRRAAERAAQSAASLGYSRCCVLADDLEAVSSAQEPKLKFMSRDALAMAIAPSTDGVDPLVALLDLRRHDERTLYGSIPSSLHVPVEQFPMALAMSPEEWARTYRFPKPELHEPLVLQCRTNRRSQWAARLAEDAGFLRVFVYREGSYGWRLASGVKAYASYELGDVPPEPEHFDLEAVDQASAAEELRSLGIIA